MIEPEKSYSASPAAREVLEAIESAERRFDASGARRSRLARSLARLFWLRQRFLAYVLARLGLGAGWWSGAELKARSIWGDRLILPPTDLYAISLYCFGMLTGGDVRMLKFVARRLQAGDIFYDIGANYGFYGLLAKKLVGNSGEVHLFEPVERLAFFLRKNFRTGEGKTFVNEVAVADRSGQAVFYEAFSSKMSGESTLLDSVAHSQPDNFHRTTVRSVALDDYVKTHSRPTMVKIDVEGAEANVLRGAEGVFGGPNKPSIVIMEVWYPPADNEGHVRAVADLEKKGYRPHSIDERGFPVPCPELLSRLRAAPGGPNVPNENFVFLTDKN